ncbi:hypothetical protein VOLCADRAFT_92093 [Volvox carteri f. nagariensis]|uniref:Uncharacterized protein n=1 Tax=Volvox carteri f. nagariensis TaxID=3068 RepID=D8TYK6_VOLCA|nr:uncharacterized protein VOLCADRAFT_92093 [Volvox carteri f. nagariensis]EFJ47411.1 hypothetical protein VOLCADRAFT_92093 [Volvox carteri f. nagariensis]|eukprot:XP_002951600.1 hypothetical protein VOLCADRAFT_92093 [Volvox carteri f. nagariensis]
MDLTSAIQAWATFNAIPATTVLAFVRPEWSLVTARSFLNNHKGTLHLGTCSFGRRGRPMLAVRCNGDTQRLLHVAGVPGDKTEAFWRSELGLAMNPSSDAPQRGAAPTTYEPPCCHASPGSCGCSGSAEAGVPVATPSAVAILAEPHQLPQHQNPTFQAQTS